MMDLAQEPTPPMADDDDDQDDDLSEEALVLALADPEARRDLLQHLRAGDRFWARLKEAGEEKQTAVKRTALDAVERLRQKGAKRARGK